MTELARIITESSVILGVVVAFAVCVVRIAKGVKCQLRSEMLHIYYKHKDAKSIHQYEMENFIYLYEAYKALRGNSFIDKIHDEVMTWQVES